MKFGIAAKISLLYFCIIVVFTFLLGFYFIQHEKNILNSELNERVNSLLSNLSINSEYPVLIKDHNAISKLVKGVLAQKDIIFCKIIDKNGIILIQEGSPTLPIEGEGSKEEKLIKEVSSAITTKEISKEMEDELVLGNLIEAKEEIGKIYLTVSLLDLNQKLTDIRKTIIIFTIITIFLSFFFSSLFLQFILGRPIDKMVIGTKKIAGGDLSFKIEIKTQDEIGYLASSFNNMMEDLQKTTVSKEELRKYAKKVEEINLELDDFTYIVSHDLKEPLRSINAFSKFLMSDYREKLDEEGRNYLERIQANAILMQKLIEDLLEVSRLERRKNPFEDANVGNMLNEIKIRMEHSLTEKKVEMIVNDTMPVVFCDRIRLTEVFANLISNAVKYADKTPPRVEVGYKDTGNYYEFFVKDNGPGIPEEYYEKIFKMFQRLVKKEEKEGTGVGLTIAKKIVEMHKGRIWVESKVGEYTTFYFTIPKNKDMIIEKKKIGEILVEKKIVDEDTIKKALEEQRKKES